MVGGRRVHRRVVECCLDGPGRPTGDLGADSAVGGGDLTRPWGDVTRKNAVPLLGLGAN